MDTPVFIQLIRMKGSFYLWVGSQPTMNRLSLALMSSLDDMPCATSIMGQDNDGFGSTFAQRLAKRTKMVAYVSYNLPPNREYLERFVQEKVVGLLCPSSSNKKKGAPKEASDKKMRKAMHEIEVDTRGLSLQA